MSNWWWGCWHCCHLRDSLMCSQKHLVKIHLTASYSKLQCTKQMFYWFFISLYITINGKRVLNVFTNTFEAEGTVVIFPMITKIALCRFNLCKYFYGPTLPCKAWIFLVFAIIYHLTSSGNKEKLQNELWGTYNNTFSSEWIW